MSSRSSGHDVVVVGSGGAGLVAACAAADVGARVLVLEAADRFGGTTALSGGQMWIPGSEQMRRAGYEDSRGDALRYLERVTLGATPQETLEAFLDQGPRLANYLENDLGIALQAVARHDYHPDWAGARFGRSLEPTPVPTTGLGTLRDRVLKSDSRGPLTAAESRTGLDEATLRARRDADVRTQGSGLVAGLVAACLRRGVELRPGHRAVALTTRSGAAAPTVTTVNVTDHRDVLTAEVAVVLACGGFAHNAELRRDFLPPLDILPLSVPTCVGDAITLGISARGALRGTAEAWWTPATALPAPRNIVRELALPGSVLINSAGRRFVDEACSYNDLGKAFLQFDPKSHTFPNASAWLVFDARFAATYPVAGHLPGDPAPDWFVTADSLATLATRLGVDGTRLHDTVVAMNGYADRGVDPDFGRGSNAHDAFNGDQNHQPNPCLGRIDTPPFYAVPVTIGMNGTKGGLVTDVNGAVLDSHGNPIDGLFAYGESAAALMGPGYAGNGAALGPSLSAALTIGGVIKRARTDVARLPSILSTAK